MKSSMKHNYAFDQVARTKRPIYSSTVLVKLGYLNSTLDRTNGPCYNNYTVIVARFPGTVPDLPAIIVKNKYELEGIDRLTNHPYPSVDD